MSITTGGYSADGEEAERSSESEDQPPKISVYSFTNGGGEVVDTNGKVHWPDLMRFIVGDKREALRLARALLNIIFHYETNPDETDPIVLSWCGQLQEIEDE